MISAYLLEMPTRRDEIYVETKRKRKTQHFLATIMFLYLLIGDVKWV